MSPDRQIILETLLVISKEDEFTNVIIKDVLDKYAYLDRQHRSFIKRVIQGTVEKKIELDYIISSFSKTPIKKMKPVILCILEMSVYQLKYMDSVPASAVCNEAVKLTKNKGFGTLSGFVNGVLRAIVRGLDTLKYPDPESDKLKYYSITYSMPEALTEFFLTNYPHQTEEILASYQTEAPTTIRINESKTDYEKLSAKLHEQGANLTKLPQIPGIEAGCEGYALNEYDKLTSLQAFLEGDFTVQDLSTMQVVAMAGLKPDDVVIDICAAPGGKALHAADTLCKLGGTGRVLSFDLSERKVNLILDNIHRCGFDNIVAQVNDARIRNESYVNQADVLIADLPCSGLGIIGRKSDIKNHVTAEGMQSLVSLQREILLASADYVKAGGTLMYSTCTLNPEENERQASWIQENLPFVLVKDRLILPTKWYDGFYIARFKKNEA